MYKLDVSDKAEQDLSRIIEYIAQKLAAPIAASDFADAVFDCYDNLDNNPYIFEQCRDAKLNKEGYRRAVIKNYILVYSVNEDTKTVIAHRFFYGRQDYVSLI